MLAQGLPAPSTLVFHSDNVTYAPGVVLRVAVRLTENLRELRCLNKKEDHASLIQTPQFPYSGNII
jgi:hypothetical protein